MSQPKKLQLEEILNQNEISLLRNIECPIDNMIPLENNAVVCKKCETVYCKDCIESWKKTNNICPMRCQPMELIPIEKTILVQQLDRIQIKCKYHNFGCTTKVGVKDPKVHENDCYYKQMECSKCKESVNDGFFLDHLISKCSKSRLTCFVCLAQHNLSAFHSHIKSCIDSFLICEVCSDYHPKESFSVDGLSNKCKMKLILCKKCNLPELSCYLTPNQMDHNCISEKFANCQFAVSNYLLYLGSRIEGLIEKKVKEKTVVLARINNEYKDISEYIEKKIQSKLYIINNKRKKVEDESSKKITLKNQLKQEENTSISIKNRQIHGKIQGKYFYLSIK